MKRIAFDSETDVTDRAEGRGQGVQIGDRDTREVGETGWGWRIGGGRGGGRGARTQNAHLQTEDRSRVAGHDQALCVGVHVPHPDLVVPRPAHNLVVVVLDAVHPLAVGCREMCVCV